MALSEDQLERFQTLLEELKAELNEGLESNVEDANTVELDTSIGRLSRIDAMQSQQMALELKRRQQNRLLRVENALKAIKDGSYGECRNCGKAIHHERLEYQPDAVVCVDCASGTRP